jgi:hypothetical protein
MHPEKSPIVEQPQHPSGVRPRKASALLVAALTGLLVYGASLAPAQGSGQAKARSAAATVPISENEFFHVKEVTEDYITGGGLASGTVAGVGSTKMNLLNATNADGEFTSGQGHNTVTAKFTAIYSISGKLAHFKGTVTSLHGTGSYAGAVGIGIKFLGTMNRVKDTMTMSATGEWTP